ncbi:hypothetical protein FDECE_13736 [Fusarium decemcellulare]|nr:hypothetical protein FDECE_13736 [Fusarium decemcellulare]
MCPEDAQAAQLQQALAENPLQVDDNDRNDDSVYASSYALTSRTSASSDHWYRNGRRYHAFREGAYLMPNDEEEQDRMDLLHHIFRLTLKGELYRSPVKDPHRVLDLGTGTGIWAMDFADEHPSAEVIGTDLSPIQPRWTPPNCVFEVDDFEAEWPHTKLFDFVHGRELEGCIADEDRFFAQAFKHLNSGGYFEMQGAYTSFLSDDNTAHKAKEVQTWCQMLVEGIEKFGKPIDTAPTWKQKMEDAGFIDVGQEIVKIPIGGWPKDPSRKELGKYQLIQQIQGAESYTPAVFSRVLGWTDEEIQVLLAKIRKEFSDPSIHLYIPGYVTDFLESHPGGKAIILRHAGTDATQAFEEVHPRELLAEYLLPKHFLGKLEIMPKSEEYIKPVIDTTSPHMASILSIAEMERLALQRLSPKALAYYASGTDDEITKVANGEIFKHILLRPRVFVDCTHCSLSTSLLGNRVELPIFISPAAMAKLAHPLGEVGIASACSRFNALQIISKNASISVADIVRAGPDAVFGWQLYVLKDTKATERTLAYIRAIPQIKFIVLTLDAPFPGKREADERYKAAEVAGGAPPQVWGTESALTWEKTLRWLSTQTNLPIVLKGIQTHEDAFTAAKFPVVKGIILSNHGGRALDTTTVPMQVLIEIRKFCPQVLDQLEVWIDGGIKRGSDVVKALALGAKGVGLGRAALYGLAVGGEQGVYRSLQILADEAMTTMRLLGASRVSELTPSHSCLSLQTYTMDKMKNDPELQKAEETEGMENLLETYANIMAEHKPNPRGPGYIRLYLLAALVFLCSTMNGFDSSLMGSINALPNYTTYFNLPENGNASTGIIGQMSGALFIWMTDWYGRTWHIFFGCLGVCIATVVTSLATNLPTFIAGRFLLSFFATCAHTAAPLYLVELAPAAYRGTIAGMYNTFYNVGSIFSTSAVYACHKYLAHSGNLDWRIPLWLQMVCPGIVCLFIKFQPESPRWLVAKDRHEEAKAIIATYHTNGDTDHPLVTLQMTEMALTLDAEHKASWTDLFDLRVLVESRSSRYRLMLNIAFSWFGQFSGNNIISYYLPIMLNGIGITDTDTKLILNIIYAVIGWCFSVLGSRLHDVIGRRKMLLATTAGMVICLALVAACAAGYTEYGNKTASTVSIVFIFLFGAVFACGFTPMQPIYPAEVVSNKMRAKAMGTFKVTAGAAGFLNTFVGPIALSNIGYWFYVFFVLWDTFEFAFIYFLFVETKGSTLEELDVIFEAKNPRKASVEAAQLRKRIIHGGQNNH